MPHIESIHLNLHEKKIAIIGIGYVGIALAIEFGKKRDVIAYDINANRIFELKNGYDRTLEISKIELNNAKYLKFSSNPDDISDCEIFIIAVPTPLDSNNNPNLDSLISATKIVGKKIKKNAVVIYESTVYPGVTEDICVPILSNESGLIYNSDFFCGYSPERINPGDKKRTIRDVIKVVSGSTHDISCAIDKLYSSIITAGTYRAASIKVAEAAKIIENTQRDVNIALVNEFSMIFSSMNIDTVEVINAAATKWNFIPYMPGLVGGHCIGVDSHYLRYRANELGQRTALITEARNINENVVKKIAQDTIQKIVSKKFNLLNMKILVMGYTFKEDCPDVRNTQVEKLVAIYIKHGINVDIYDPWINLDEVKATEGVSFLAELPVTGIYSAIVLAVSHKYFIDIGIKKIKSFGIEGCIIIDIKSIFKKSESDLRM